MAKCRGGHGRPGAARSGDTLFGLRDSKALCKRLVKGPPCLWEVSCSGRPFLMRLWTESADQGKWAGDRLPLRPLSIDRSLSPETAYAYIDSSSVRTFRREVPSVACVPVACDSVVSEGGLSEWLCMGFGAGRKVRTENETSPMTSEADQGNGFTEHHDAA